MAAMRAWREYPMVQLCGLLCMVPLALENTVLQVAARLTAGHACHAHCKQPLSNGLPVLEAPQGTVFLPIAKCCRAAVCPL